MIHYSTQGHVFSLERDQYAMAQFRWTAVDGYFGRGDGRSIVATASSEAALRRECRKIAERRNSRRELLEWMNRRSS
jgi:hypothetical protein